jgi:hypothetical protein
LIGIVRRTERYETNTSLVPEDNKEAEEIEDLSGAMELADEQGSSELSEHHSAAASELFDDVGRAMASLGLGGSMKGPLREM